MSDAKKCDRCGKFYDIYKPVDGVADTPCGFGFRFLDKWGSLLPTRYDLCPNCMCELTKWLTNPKEEQNV